MDAPGRGWSKKGSLFQAMLVDGQDTAELGGEDRVKSKGSGRSGVSRPLPKVGPPQSRPNSTR